jgi:hypothetical protein
MGDDRIIRSGLINMIREKAQKGKSAYAIDSVKILWVLKIKDM